MKLPSFVVLLIGINIALLSGLVREIRAVGEPLYLNAPVTFGSGYTVKSGQFTDSTNNAYHLSSVSNAIDK